MFYIFVFFNVILVTANLWLLQLSAGVTEMHQKVSDYKGDLEQ